MVHSGGQLDTSFRLWLTWWGSLFRYVFYSAYKHRALVIGDNLLVITTGKKTAVKVSESLNRYMHRLLLCYDSTGWHKGLLLLVLSWRSHPSFMGKHDHIPDQRWPVSRQHGAAELLWTGVPPSSVQINQLGRSRCWYVQDQLRLEGNSGGHWAQPPAQCYMLSIANGQAVILHCYMPREINNTLNTCRVI